MCVGAEPIPYIAREAVKQALLDGPKLSRDVLINPATTRSWSPPSSVELMTLPVCLQFARTLGARSVVGRRMIAAERMKSAAAAASRRTRSLSEASTAAADAAAAADQDDDEDDDDAIDEPTSSRHKAVVHSKRLHSAFI